MKRILKSINERPFLAFLVACLVAVSSMAVKEYRRIAKFADNEVVQLPAGLYIGGNGSDTDPTLVDSNKVTKTFGLVTSTLDAGLFSNSACTWVQPVQTVTGAKVGDVCHASFKATNVRTHPGSRSDELHCEVTDAGIVSLTLCAGVVALDAGPNIPVYGTANIRVWSNQ